MKPHNTIFLRLDGPLQSWGITSRFVVRDTADVPSKSGVLGLICAAMGLRRAEANQWLKGEAVAALRMGVRIDRPGTKLVDFHTAGAKLGMMTAGGVIKKTATTNELETHVMRKEYLADASFLVALHGNPEIVQKIAKALQDPVWPPFLGRKSCPPSVPVFAKSDTFDEPDTPNALAAALASIPWSSRLPGLDEKPKRFLAVIESTPADGWPVSDVPVSFTHRVYGTRWVKEIELNSVLEEKADLSEPPRRSGRPPTSFPGWSDATENEDGEPKGRRNRRLKLDYGLCVFCKQSAREVHHVSYARVGYEPPEDLRSVCSLCHDAMTLLEYAAGMAGDRIDPCDPKNRQAILAQRTNVLTQRDRLRRNRALRTEED